MTIKEAKQMASINKQNNLGECDWRILQVEFNEVEREIRLKQMSIKEEK